MSTSITINVHGSNNTIAVVADHRVTVTQTTLEAAKSNQKKIAAAPATSRKRLGGYVISPKPSRSRPDNPWHPTDCGDH